jgi:signal transduction histidine kinase
LILAVERAVGRGERAPWGKPTLAPGAQKVIEHAVDEVRQMKHNYIGAEHLLLGLLREGDSLGTQVLNSFVDLSVVRSEIVILAHNAQSSDRETVRQRQKRLFPMLHVGATQARGSTAAVVQAERTRLARDLHDSIKQQLFSISVSAAAVRERWEKDPAGALAALADVQQSARGAMVEMDALLKQLRPNPLETTGLLEALREQCEALAFRTGAEVTSYFAELPAAPALPLATHETLFRIAQEALANVARHARATQVHVRLERGLSANCLYLIVRDNGQGFDPRNVGPGMGIANMTQRAHSLQGKLEMESSPGHGTILRVEIPLVEQVMRDE